VQGDRPVEVEPLEVDLGVRTPGAGGRGGHLCS
jgi:hypothetical protein